MLVNKEVMTPLLLVAISVLWYLVFQQALESAFYIWSISEIFNHCFLVLPIAFYLIYSKRQDVQTEPMKISYLALIALVPILFLNVFGMVGSINVFTHIAAFSFIPFFIIAAIGLRAAKKIAFPLAFMLMAIPIGEELIPLLQSITADLAIILLNMTSIPVYRSGLYIDIPAGKFLVAEACSGISFLISSIAFGSLYAHLNFYSNKSKILFTILATTIPILANAVRVFGIIVIAHLSDMEHAAGADHLIYGWFFYLLVLAIVFFVGEFFSRRQAAPPKTDVTLQPIAHSNLAKGFGATALLLLTTLVVQNNLLNSEAEPAELTNESSAVQPIREVANIGLEFDTAIAAEVVARSNDGRSLVLRYKYQDLSASTDMISNKNELFDKKQWSVVRTHNLQSDGHNHRVIELTSVTGQPMLLSRWYDFGDFKTSSQIKGKLYETYLKMFGQFDTAYIYVVISNHSLSVDKHKSLEKLQSFLQQVDFSIQEI